MAFEMKGLRQIMRVSWTAKKTNLWVLQQAGVERSLLQSIKERKLKYCGHVLRKQGESLEKDILEGTMPGRGVVTALKPVRAEQVRRPERVGLFCLGLSLRPAL